MDSSVKYENPSPEASASIFSKCFYCWTFAFFKLGYENDVERKDIYNTTKEDMSEPLGDELQKNWENEIKRKNKRNKKPSLKCAIFKTFSKSYSKYGVCLFLQSILLKMLQPIVLAEYIRYYDIPTKEADPATGWLLGTGVVVMAFVNILVTHYMNLGCQRVGMRVRTACSSLVYRKLFKLSRASLDQMQVGQLVNLLSNDVQRFDKASIYLHYAWIMPIQAVIAFYVMYTNVGVATVVGVLAIVLVVALQGYMSKLQGKWRFQIAQKTDQRVKLMSEITAGMHVIKMYAWEKPFEKIIAAARRLEIDLVKKTSYVKGIYCAMMVFTEKATLCFTLITYVLLGNRLTGDVVFSMAQLFNTIQLYAAVFFPMAISSYAEADASVKRLEKFLLSEENTEMADTNAEKICDMERKGTIEIEKVDAGWLPNSSVATLTDINLDIRPGTLCCVVGHVGSGKSSLLQLLLRELPINTGRMDISGSTSYASEEPWLFVSSIRDNILFGRPYLEDRYNAVVKVCALQRDFEQLPHGDKTQVGERGVALSGGQRARINLARAVYFDADIYLFEDPLSAVDTQVAKHLFQQCFKTYLKDKTRILVTHQLQFLKEADLIVIIDNGRVEKVCRYDELSEKELENLNQEQVKEETEKENVQEAHREQLQSTTSNGDSMINEEEPQETDELIEKGAIPTSTYLEYCRAGATIFVLLCLVLLFVTAQISLNASDLWITHWTNAEESKYQLTKNPTGHSNNSTHLANAIPNSTNFNINSTETPAVMNATLKTSPEYNITSIRSRDSYILVYTVFILISIVLTSAAALLFYKICMNASINLHDKMFSHILQVPRRFFDTNPSGRILNRFSKDLGAVDEALPNVAIDALQIFFIICGTLITVFIVTQWIMFPSVILGAIFFCLRIIYMKSAQNLKRLEATTKAPIFSHISETLHGMSTIRSSQAEQMLAKEFDVLQDQHTSASFLFLATSEAFGFYLDLINVVFLTVVTFQYLIFRDESTVSGDVGLVIFQSLTLIGILQYGVRQTAELASNMTSVERVLQYTKLEKEGPFESLPANRPDRDWPRSGNVVFKNVYVRYTLDQQPVLKNLNMEIKPGEKVGIVGRTGAGKSTLITSLFRLAPIEGTITIDDVDTSKIGLNDLRSNISIIPQEQTLFSSSIRYNLDPFEKVSDEKLWQALENVELKTAIDNLDQQVSEGGSNFSAGQRQLICLARAIIKNNKLVVMDEATANVDPQTDSLIQKSIRTNFAKCTVITIAHRLNTIMDSDRVLVMDAGRAVEFDHPHRLLQKPHGFFTRMVKQTGGSMEAILRKKAREGYERKREKEVLVEGDIENKTNICNGK